MTPSTPCAQLIYDRTCPDVTRARAMIRATLEAIVGSRAAAWDTWMVFDKQTSWRAGVSRPAWWEHQMSSIPPDLMLNADLWASRAVASHDVNADHR